MEFIVDRTSSLYTTRKKQPLEEAYLKLSADNEREWCITLDTLDDLIELHKKVKTSLIVSSYDGKHYIEIYDDYRE